MISRGFICLVQQCMWSVRSFLIVALINLWRGRFMCNLCRCVSFLAPQVERLSLSAARQDVQLVAVSRRAVAAETACAALQQRGVVKR